MCEQTATLNHLVSTFNAMRKRFIIANLAIENWPIIYSNDQFNELVDRRQADVIGRPITNCELWFAYERAIENSNDKWTQLKLHIKQRQKYQFQAFLRKSNGKHINCRIQMSPIENTELAVILFEIKETLEPSMNRLPSRPIHITLNSSSIANQMLADQKTNSFKKIKKCSSNYQFLDYHQSEPKLSVLSPHLQSKPNSRDGASIIRSKSMENAGMNLDNRYTLELLYSDTNLSCKKLDHLAANLKSVHDLTNKDKSEYETRKKSARLKFNAKNQNENEISTLRLRTCIMKAKKYGPKILIRKIPTSRSMTNDLRVPHLHTIRDQLIDKLKEDETKNRPILFQTKSTRRQSTGEMLRNSQNPKYDIAPQNDLTKILNESLFKGSRALTMNNHSAENHLATTESYHQPVTNSSNNEQILNNNDDRSINSRTSSISSKISSTKSTISKCYSKASSSSPFRLQFNYLLSNRTKIERRTSYSSTDGSVKGILKGVQAKLTTNLSNKVAQ